MEWEQGLAEDPSEDVMGSPAIRLVDLRKTYRMGETQVEALCGVDLQVQTSEYIAIMGPSGSGKSTLMNIIGCLDRPTSGQYFLEEVNVSSLDRDQRAEIRNHRIGFVFQNFNLLPRTSALENVELPLLYSRKDSWTGPKIRARATECLERVGLTEWAQHTPSQLSGGQQQRVAIARALVNRPSILLADEPTGNMDTGTSEQIMGIFTSLNSEGMTIVLITHEMDIASNAQRLIMLRDGRVQSDQSVHLIAERSS